MTGVREEKKRAARARLYAEALRLIEAKGFDAVTTAEIAAAAGVAKGTVFNYFPTKADVLADWYAERTERALLASARAPEAPLEDQLFALCWSFIETASSHPGMWRAKRREAPSCAAIQRVELETDAAVRIRAEKLIARARTQGAVRRSVDPEALSDLYLAILSGTTSEALATGEEDLKSALRRRIDALCALARD